MAEKPDNFWGGFLIGTVLGATLGTIVALKVRETTAAEEEVKELDNRDIALTLEEKIAQLNAAIDAVSEELAITNNKRPA